VPDENLLGEENRGFYLIMANFQWERLAMSLGAVAKMEHLIERTVEYAKERTAFGRPIGGFQAIRHKIAEMATKIETARQMVYTTAWRFQNGEYPVREITIAKLYSARIAVEVADECIQIHGGNGYMKEYGIERSWRDLRLNRIGAGSDEIMLEVIGRSFGL
jgi:alkylation response protein AidB-like acyl-CoA dehydrogenase